MGYTHYWSATRDFTASEWKDICAATRSVLSATDVKIVREYDRPNDRPDILDDEILLNGSGDDGHETFYLSRDVPAAPDYRDEGDPDFQFCKTARKPYDDVVVAILIAARDIAPDAFSWSSDGYLEEHADGLALLNRATSMSVSGSNARAD
jgi:hypothetical protein